MDKTLWHATYKHVCGRQPKNKIQPLWPARSQAERLPHAEQQDTFSKTQRKTCSQEVCPPELPTAKLSA